MLVSPLSACCIGYISIVPSCVWVCMYVCLSVCLHLSLQTPFYDSYPPFSLSSSLVLMLSALPLFHFLISSVNNKQAYILRLHGFLQPLIHPWTKSLLHYPKSLMQPKFPLLSNKQLFHFHEKFKLYPMDSFLHPSDSSFFERDNFYFLSAKHSTFCAIKGGNSRPRKSSCFWREASTPSTHHHVSSLHFQRKWRTMKSWTLWSLVPEIITEGRMGFYVSSSTQDLILPLLIAAINSFIINIYFREI